MDNLKIKSTTFSNENINTELTLCGESNDLGLVLYTSGSTGVPKGNKSIYIYIKK